MSAMATCTLGVEIEPGTVRLVRTAFRALDGSDEAAAAVHDRLMASGRWLESAPMPKGIRVRIEPMAELALREIATFGPLDDATKARRVGETLSLAGY